MSTKSQKKRSRSNSKLANYEHGTQISAERMRPRSSSGSHSKRTKVAPTIEDLSKQLVSLVKRSDQESKDAIFEIVEQIHERVCHEKSSGVNAKQINIAALAKVATYHRFESSKHKALELLKMFPEDSVTELLEIKTWADVDSSLGSNVIFVLAVLGTEHSIRPLMDTIDKMSIAQTKSFKMGLGYSSTAAASRALDAIYAHLAGEGDLIASPHRSVKRKTRLDWIVLPVGFWNEPKYLSEINRFSAGAKSPGIFLERLKFAESLEPQEIFQGMNSLGTVAYWVFVFDDYVLAECPLYGNAAYLIQGTTDWKSLLSMSKREILESRPEMVTKMIHTPDFEERIKNETQAVRK